MEPGSEAANQLLQRCDLDWPPAANAAVDERATIDLPSPLLARFDQTCAAVQTVMQKLGGTNPGVSQRLLSARSERRGWRPGRDADGFATSANGSAVLLPAADGWIVLNLARLDDVHLLPAWFGQLSTHFDEACSATFAGDRVALAARTRLERAVDLERTGRLVGLPVAQVPRSSRRPDAPFRAAPGGLAPSTAPLRILDISSMWAGPLAARILGHLDSVVTRIESPGRRDGFHTGDPEFYDWLNEGKDLRLLDPSVPEDRDALIAEVGRADVVVSSSRARVFAQWGLDPAELAGRGIVWIAITGYGLTGTNSHAVAFGDDAAAAAGAVHWPTDERDASPTFVGDALADPVTGVTAALAGLAAIRARRGAVLDVSMVDAVRWHHAAGSPRS